MCGPNRRKIETEAVGGTKNHVSEVFRALEKTLGTEAVGDIKKRISEVFRGLEKCWPKCIIYERGITLNKYFL